MKKFLVLLVSGLLLLGATGCDQVGEIVNSALDTAIESTTDMDDVYSDLSSIISSPSNLESAYNEYINKKITFTAVILSDPEVWDFDEEENSNQTYVWAAISRNNRNEFLINLEGIPEASRPSDGDIVSVTGEIQGTIYTVYDNEKSDYVDFLASDITPKEPTGEPDTSNKIPVSTWNSKGDISFTAAELTADSFDAAALVYYEFTNTGEKDAAPSLSTITFYQGDTLLTTSIFSIEAELNPMALNGTSAPDETPAGKTLLYYTVLKPEDTSAATTTSDPITAYLWDDDFNCTHMVTIPLGEAMSEGETAEDATSTEETESATEEEKPAA